MSVQRNYLYSTRLANHPFRESVMADFGCKTMPKFIRHVTGKSIPDIESMAREAGVSPCGIINKILHERFPNDEFLRPLDNRKTHKFPEQMVNCTIRVPLPDADVLTQAARERGLTMHKLIAKVASAYAKKLQGTRTEAVNITLTTEHKDVLPDQTQSQDEPETV